MRADGDAAGSDHHIRLERLLERSPVRTFVVANRRHQLDSCPGSCKLSRQEQPVCLVDLTRGKRLARTAKLSSRRENGGARPLRAPGLRNPGRGQGAEPCGCERRAGLGDDLAGSGVAPTRPNIRPGLRGTVDLDFVVTFDNILDGDDDICTLGNRTAR